MLKRSPRTKPRSVRPASRARRTARLEGADTAAISGPIFAGPDSHPKYLDVPGTRPDPAERERWRTDLFPIANVFYRTSAARALGGFDERLERRSGSLFGWETDLSWRLERAGWQVRFCETLAISTVFRPPASNSPLEQVRRDLGGQRTHLGSLAPLGGRGRRGSGRRFLGHRLVERRRLHTWPVVEVQVLHDLAELGQFYRIAAFIGVAVIAMMASFAYQRFFASHAKQQQN